MYPSTSVQLALEQRTGVNATRSSSQRGSFIAQEIDALGHQGGGIQPAQGLHGNSVNRGLIMAETVLMYHHGE